MLILGHAALWGSAPPASLHSDAPASPAATIFSRRSAPRRSVFAASGRLHMSRREILSFDPAADFPASGGDAAGWPYSAADFGRLDGSDDARFYAEPKFVQHVDDRAVESLVEYYREEMEEARVAKGGPPDVLDVCSSWTSHFPPATADAPTLGRVAGLGLNAAELQKNDRLTERHVRDLNAPDGADLSDLFSDASFDVVAMSLSVDYLIRPLDVFRELARVLRPGGRLLVTFSDRCFPTKAVAAWLSSDDVGRLAMVATYLHVAVGEWEEIVAWDIKLPPLESPQRPGMRELMKDPALGLAWAAANAAAARTRGGDPLYCVRGIKEEDGGGKLGRG